MKKNKVKVFEQPSRNENMMITIIPNEQFLGDQIPVDYLGRTIHVGWPHLIEAKYRVAETVKFFCKFVIYIELLPFRMRKGSTFIRVVLGSTTLKSVRRQRPLNQK